MGIFDDAELSVVADCVAEAAEAEDVDLEALSAEEDEAGAVAGAMVVDFRPTPPGPNETLSLAIVVFTSGASEPMW